MLPSIPANPRLAYVVTPLRGVANPSRSRIGREDETKRAAPSGIPAAISLAIDASFQPSSSVITFAQRCEYFAHC